MSYNTEILLPDKFLMPDGSIVTFEGAEVAPPDEKRAQLYVTRQEQAAKWLLPDGSIVSGLPLNMSLFEEVFVPRTTKINNRPLSGDITLTAEDIGIEDPQETSISKSASATLSAAECTNAIIFVYGQSGNITLTLPPAFQGGHFTIVIGQTAAYYLRITPSGSEVQSFDGIDLTAGYYVYTSTMTKGYMIQYVAIETGASTYQWAALTVVGDWYAQT